MFIAQSARLALRMLTALIIAGVLSGMLSACSSNETSATPPAPPEEQGEKEGILHPAKAVPFPKSRYSHLSTEVMHNHRAQTIALYVDAEKGPDGQWGWDDGQRWLLVVQDAQTTYPLFDGRIQLGDLAFWVIDDGGERSIVLLETGTAHLKLRTYRYDAEKDAFVESVVYDAGAINLFPAQYD